MLDFKLIDVNINLAPIEKKPKKLGYDLELSELSDRLGWRELIL